MGFKWQLMGVCCNSIHGRGALKLNIKGRVIWRAVGVSSVFGLTPLILREKYAAWPSKYKTSAPKQRKHQVNQLNAPFLVLSTGLAAVYPIASFYRISLRILNLLLRLLPVHNENLDVV